MRDGVTVRARICVRLDVGYSVHKRLQIESFSVGFYVEKYHNYLLNHGCNVDEEIRRFVRDYYASFATPPSDFLSPLIPGPGPIQTPPQQVEAMAERMVLIYDGRLSLRTRVN
jgi:hypothetical protein